MAHASRLLRAAATFAAVLAWSATSTAQTAPRPEAFGLFGPSFGDPGTSAGSMSYGGSVSLPLRTLLRISADVHTFVWEQTLVGAALAAEGPPGRRVRGVVAAGAGAVRYSEPHREGTVPVLYGEAGVVMTVSKHVLMRVDSVFWAGRATGAVGIRFGAGYRF